jgi:hypothetical protein
LIGQFIDRGTGFVTGYQFGDLRCPEALVDLLGGSRIMANWARWLYVDQGLEALSLVKKVRPTSHYLHQGPGQRPEVESPQGYEAPRALREVSQRLLV